MRARLLLLPTLALASLAAVLLPAGAGATVERGTITVNRGAAGVTLGMSRTQVVVLLGQPLYENENGYMQYSKKNLFDVYLGPSGRVDLIGVSGPGFCTAGGICMLAGGGLGKLRAKFGSGLKYVVLHDGPRYRIAGRLNGRRVFTEFYTDGGTRQSARIVQIFIGAG